MNFTAIWTLTKKELKRFIRVPGQTIGSPIVTTLLYFIIFSVAIGDRVDVSAGLTYGEFIMPGLIMMNVMSGSLMSVASALMLSKMMNTLSDVLLSPMSYLEMILGYVISSVLRSLVTGSLIYLTALFFVPFRVEHPLYLLGFVLIISTAFALGGLIIGIWADTFEQVSIFPTFLITPLSFMGGIFYSITALPQTLQNISRFNPLLYMINGMRYGFYGVSDVNQWVALAVGVGLLVLLMLVTWRMFSTGYKIKS